jgi:hypothetical protein
VEFVNQRLEEESAFDRFGHGNSSQR